MVAFIVIQLIFAVHLMDFILGYIIINLCVIFIVHVSLSHNGAEIASAP